VRLWDLRQPGSPPRALGTPRSGGGPARAADTAHARDGATGEAAVSSLAFQPGGRLLAAGALDGGIRLWDLDHAAVATRLDAGGKRVLSLACSPDGALLAAGLGQGGGALLWNLRQPASQARVTCSGKDVRAVAFSPNGKILACGTGQGDVLLENPAGPGPPAGIGAAVIRGPATAINFLRFSPDGGWLATAEGDGSARLWSLRRPAAGPVVLPGHESWVWAVAFSPDGSKLLTGSEDRTIHVWSPHSAQLATRICRQLHRDLTADERARYLPIELRSERAATCPPGA